MRPVRLDTIRDSLDGYIPAVIATCDAEGVPNVSILSEVHYVDPEHVALSYQFFNKTRRNVMATRCASVAIVDHVTLAQYRLALDYQETLTSGPLFESMKAKLAGIASHSGMQDVFRLLGADIYRVRAIELIPTETLPPQPARALLAATRRACDALTRSRDLADLFEIGLDALGDALGIEHAMILVRDADEQQLYTVASRGYAKSGIGSEVNIGEGVIGAAAREGVPIRINHMTTDYAYNEAIGEKARMSGLSWECQTLIPFPGLDEPQSQVAVPIVQCGRVTGVLFAESTEPLRFNYDDEDALAIFAGHLGAAMALLHRDETTSEAAPPAATPVTVSEAITVRHYGADDSVFLGHDYLIKGVAGAIFWRLVREYVAHGRVEFSNRELRLDPSLRLPGFAENLEARLILLYRRLEERNAGVRIEKCGRGRFRLAVSCPLKLEEMAAVDGRTAAV